MTNCVNCGAILHGNKCEYCGTEYENNSQSNNLTLKKETENSFLRGMISWISHPPTVTPLCHMQRRSDER